MNNLPQVSAIIFQIFVTSLTLIASLIVTYFGYKLNQQNKSRDDTKLQLIKAATHDVQTYTDKAISQGEYKDAIEYIIYKIPVETEEISKAIRILEKKIEVIRPRLIFFLIINICATLLEIGLTFFLDLELLPKLIIFLSTTLILLITIGVTVKVFIPFVKDARKTIKKHELFSEELVHIKKIGNNILISRADLTKLINQRNKLGFGTSISNIKNELDMYGIAVKESDIIRSHLDIFYPNSKDRNEILTIFHQDGKLHESFDELSDEEILTFLETVEKNIESLESQKTNNDP